MFCTGYGPGHGRTGGLTAADLPMGETPGEGFVPVTFGAAGGGELELCFPDGAVRTVWHCDHGYLMVYLMLKSCGPVHYHAETSLLVAGAPEIRRFLSVGRDGPTPCRRLARDPRRRVHALDLRTATTVDLGRGGGGTPPSV